MIQEELLEMAEMSSPGEFLVVANVNGEETPRREKVNFKPEPGTENVVQYVLGKLTRIADRVERLQITGKKGNRFTCTFPENMHQHDSD